MPMEVMTWRSSPELRLRLKKACAVHGLSVSDVVREALEVRLEEMDRTAPPRERPKKPQQSAVMT
jgi:hypothetical protein